MTTTVDLAALKKVIQETKKLAKQYRQITGKPLGITGEVGEYIAAELLHLNLTEARNPGYDALGQDGRRIQIKSRCVRSTSSQRVGRIKLDYDFDTVILVLMDDDFEPLSIYEAQRKDVERELQIPGSKSRNIRGAIGVRKFVSISSNIWSREKSIPGSSTNTSSNLKSITLAVDDDEVPCHSPAGGKITLQ